MGRCLVKQSNGYWAEWSTVTDSFTAINCSKDEMIEHRIQSNIKELEREIERLRKTADTMFEYPYYQKSWKDAVCFFWLRHIKDIDTTKKKLERYEQEYLDMWEYIKQHVDPTVPDMVAHIEFDENGNASW